MAQYEAGVLSAAPSTTNQFFSTLWNPGSENIWLHEIGITQGVSGVTIHMEFARISARGTQTATLGGTALDPNDAAPQGTVDSAWSVQPTISGSDLRHLNLRSFDGEGAFLLWQFEDRNAYADTGKGLVIPAGKGVGLYLPTNTVTTTWETYYAWRE